MVYMGSPYIFYMYMIKCGWLGNRTQILVVSRSTVNPLPSDLVLSDFSIRASPNPDITGVRFGSRLTFEDRVD